MLILILFAFVAGVITILSPCILPVLPIILSSATVGGRKRPIGIVVGFIASFTFFTLFLSTIVRLLGISADSLRSVSVFIIAIFGLTLIIPEAQLKIEQLFAKFSSLAPAISQQNTSFLGGILIGLSLGLLWTPCVGPILASVISLALTGSVTASSFLITLSYSIGTTIPMLIILFAGQSALRRVPWLLNNSAKIQRVFGIVMIATAIAILLNFDRKFQIFILDKFPQYGTGLTSIEDNQTVRDELNKTNSQPMPESSLGKPMDQIVDENFYPDVSEVIPGGKWFNSEPLKLSDLRGRVVIVDFWTYTCINCQRTLPYLKAWYEKYKDQGLVIIGVHSPEFEFEKNAGNVQKAIADFEIKYPVVQDNNFATWNAYSNHYWPAKYFIDKNGKIRFTHFGEGAYDESEEVIQQLLTETGVQVNQTINNPSYSVNTSTPETYLGYNRMDKFLSPESVQQNTVTAYSKPIILSPNFWALEGKWMIGSEYDKPSNNSSLYFHFNAKEVYLVMRGAGKVKVSMDDKEIDQNQAGEDVLNSEVVVNEDKLYKLIKLPLQADHTLKLEFVSGIVEVYAFTFG